MMNKDVSSSSLLSASSTNSSAYNFNNKNGVEGGRGGMEDSGLGASVLSSPATPGLSSSAVTPGLPVAPEVKRPQASHIPIRPVPLSHLQRESTTASSVLKNALESNGSSTPIRSTGLGGQSGGGHRLPMSLAAGVAAFRPIHVPSSANPALISPAFGSSSSPWTPAAISTPGGGGHGFMSLGLGGLTNASKPSSLTVPPPLSSTASSTPLSSSSLPRASVVEADARSIASNDTAFEDGSESTCSRATPFNHKTLKKWRQHSCPNGGNTSTSTTTSSTNFSSASSPFLVDPVKTEYSHSTPLRPRVGKIEPISIQTSLQQPSPVSSTVQSLRDIRRPGAAPSATSTSRPSTSLSGPLSAPSSLTVTTTSSSSFSPPFPPLKPLPHLSSSSPSPGGTSSTTSSSIISPRGLTTPTPDLIRPKKPPPPTPSPFGHDQPVPPMPPALATSPSAAAIVSPEPPATPTVSNSSLMYNPAAAAMALHYNINPLAAASPHFLFCPGISPYPPPPPAASFMWNPAVFRFSHPPGHYLTGSPTVIPSGYPAGASHHMAATAAMVEQQYAVALAAYLEQQQQMQTQQQQPSRMSNLPSTSSETSSSSGPSSRQPSSTSPSLSLSENLRRGLKTEVDDQPQVVEQQRPTRVPELTSILNIPKLIPLNQKEENETKVFERKAETLKTEVDQPEEEEVEESELNISVGEDEQKRDEPSSEPQQPLNGLELLSESAQKVEKADTEKSKDERRTSTGLDILIDAADSVESGSTSGSRDQRLVFSAPGTPLVFRKRFSNNSGSFSSDISSTSSRSSPRSKSLDGGLARLRGDVNRNYSSPEAAKNIRAYLKTKRSRSTGSHPLCGAGRSFDTPEMKKFEARVKADLQEIRKQYKKKYNALFQLDRQKSSPSKKSNHHHPKSIEIKASDSGVKSVIDQRPLAEKQKASVKIAKVSPVERKPNLSKRPKVESAMVKPKIKETSSIQKSFLSNRTAAINALSLKLNRSISSNNGHQNGGGQQQSHLHQHPNSASRIMDNYKWEVRPNEPTSSSALTTIKFKSDKPSPFQNLLKLTNLKQQQQQQQQSPSPTNSTGQPLSVGVEKEEVSAGETKDLSETFDKVKPITPSNEDHPQHKAKKSKSKKAKRDRSRSRSSSEERERKKAKKAKKSHRHHHKHHRNGDDHHPRRRSSSPLSVGSSNSGRSSPSKEEKHHKVKKEKKRKISFDEEDHDQAEGNNARGAVKKEKKSKTSKNGSADKAGESSLDDKGRSSSSNSKEVDIADGKTAKKHQYENLAGEACRVTLDQLKEKVPILARMHDGHFHPGWIQEISPPDIYGIVIKSERGHKPHIHPAQNVLDIAIHEIAPESLADLPVGLRVCAFWSAKYTYLFPGTVGDPAMIDKKLGPGYVNVELDDGDSRDIHYKDIRYLPPDYPIVEYGEENEISRLRNSVDEPYSQAFSSADAVCRLQSSILSTSPTKSNNGLHQPMPSMKLTLAVKAPVGLQQQQQRPRKDSTASSVASSKAGSPTKKKAASSPTKQRPTPVKRDAVKVEPPSSDEESEDEDAEDDDEDLSGSEESDFSDFDSPANSKKSKTVKKKLKIPASKRRKTKAENNLTGISAFLPPNQLWRWAASSAEKKNKRIFYKSIVRSGSKAEGSPEKLSVGDCAVFLSTGRPDRPFIGRLAEMWETPGGNRRVKVKWFYHSSETQGRAKTGKRVDDLTHAGALFESNHFDENDLQTIAHKCDVVSLTEFKAVLAADPSKAGKIYENHDLYYLAGNHDPVSGSIVFEDDIF